MVDPLFTVITQGCLQFVIAVFPDHTHLLFLYPVGPRLPKPVFRVFYKAMFKSALNIAF